MSQSDSPESSTPPLSQRSEKTSQPPGPLTAPAARDLDAERDWTVGDDGVVDEPSDRSRPSFDDELDPTDAP
jgi:hypothetical protein